MASLRTGGFLSTAAAKAILFNSVLMLLVVSHSGCSSVPAGINGISNFKEVSPGIYRGGQPTEAGWLYLQSLGIKTVVKLNFASEGADQKAVDLGMQLVDASGPPSTRSPFDFLRAPEPERIRLAVNSLANPELQPVFVHCSHGEDRTGLIVGLFRVVHDGWTKQQAFEEMQANGFHSSLVGLRKFWSNFDGETLP